MAEFARHIIIGAWRNHGFFQVAHLVLNLEQIVW
jgi:hypothetical protein